MPAHEREVRGDVRKARLWLEDEQVVTREDVGLGEGLQCRIHASDVHPTV